LATLSNIIEKTNGTSTIESIDSSDFNVSVFPNPANPDVKLSFNITDETDIIVLNVYNVKGQKVKELINKKMSTGYHNITWDGKDSIGKKLPSGVYFIKLLIENRMAAINRIILIK